MLIASIFIRSPQRKKKTTRNIKLTSKDRQNGGLCKQVKPAVSLVNYEDKHFNVENRT